MAKGDKKRRKSMFKLGNKAGCASSRHHAGTDPSPPDNSPPTPVRLSEEMTDWVMNTPVGPSSEAKQKGELYDYVIKTKKTCR